MWFFFGCGLCGTFNRFCSSLAQALPNNHVISKPQPINDILELDNALYTRVARRVKWFEYMHLYSVLFFWDLCFNEPCNRLKKICSTYTTTKYRASHSHSFATILINIIKFFLFLSVCIGWWRSNNYICMNVVVCVYTLLVFHLLSFKVCVLC